MRVLICRVLTNVVLYKAELLLFLLFMCGMEVKLVAHEL